MPLLESVPNFRKLEQAMRAWVHEAIAVLSNGPEPDPYSDLRRWQRDTDGVFRERERLTTVWGHSQVEALQQLPTWNTVMQAFQEDERLRPQIGQLVGTAQGSSHFDAWTAGRIVLPQPDELDDLETAFLRRYERLDRFLAAQEIEHVVVWPLAGLTSSTFPIALEQDVEIGLMTDQELTAALNTEVLRPIHPGIPLLPHEEAQQACLHYRYRLPKVIGDADDPARLDQFQGVEQQLNGIRDAFEQVLALLFAKPVAISGRVSFESDWTLHSGAMHFQQVPLTQAQRFRKMHLDDQACAELVEMWRRLRQPGLLQRQKALALALRRLSYQALRERIEDEMVDVLIAAEALYLSDSGFQELNFRLALRAAALCDPRKLDMSRREVFDLMKSAYAVRSKIVHGEAPKAKDVKVKEAQVPLADFIQAIEGVVRQGLREALTRAANPTSTWPPDWDDMTLPR
jgi:hypothetical protein